MPGIHSPVWWCNNPSINKRFDHTSVLAPILDDHFTWLELNFR